MPDQPVHPKDQADRFARARESQSVALLEDYVEMIGDLHAELGEARVADIAERMGVAQPTATKAISRLKREDLATSRPYRGVFLTEAGTLLADRVRARHRTVVAFLVAVGVPADVAELDAEGIEHHVSAPDAKGLREIPGECRRQRAPSLKHSGVALIAATARLPATVTMVATCDDLPRARARNRRIAEDRGARPGNDTRRRMSMGTKPEPRLFSDADPLLPQRRQTDPGCLEPAIYGQPLTGDIAGLVGTQPDDGFGNFSLVAIAVQGDRIVIGVDDVLRMDCHSQFGPHRAGAYAIRADAEFPQLDRLLLCQMRHARLAGAIGHAQCGSPQSRDRRDVDDGAPSVAQGRREGLRHQEHAVQIGRHDAPPALERRALDRAEVRDTGVVDQGIDPAQGVECGRHQRGHGGFVADIAGQGDCARQTVCGTRQFFGVIVDHGHPSTLGQKQFCRCQPDPPRRARHHCRLVHVCLRP